MVKKLTKKYYPFIGPFDPCPPIECKTYSTPPNLYLGYQPMNLQQFNPYEALKRGTLWPALYDEYNEKRRSEHE